MLGLLLFFEVNVALAILAVAAYLSSDTAKEARKKKYFGSLDMRPEEPLPINPRVWAKPNARFRKPSWKEG